MNYKNFYVSTAQLQILRKRSIKIVPSLGDGLAIENPIEYTEVYQTAVRNFTDALTEKLKQKDMTLFRQSVDKAFDKCTTMNEYFSRLRRLLNKCPEVDKTQLTVKSFAILFSALDSLFYRRQLSPYNFYRSVSMLSKKLNPLYQTQRENRKRHSNSKSVECGHSKAKRMCLEYITSEISKLSL